MLGKNYSGHRNVLQHMLCILRHRRRTVTRRWSHFCREYTGCLTYWMYFGKAYCTDSEKIFKIDASLNITWGISCAFSDTAAARLYSGGRISAENMLDI